jgi:hypothetical protein
MQGFRRVLELPTGTLAGAGGFGKEKGDAKTLECSRLVTADILE